MSNFTSSSRRTLRSNSSNSNSAFSAINPSVSRHRSRSPISQVHAGQMDGEEDRLDGMDDALMNSKALNATPPVDELLGGNRPANEDAHRPNVYNEYELDEGHPGVSPICNNSATNNYISPFVSDEQVQTAAVLQHPIPPMLYVHSSFIYSTLF